MRIGISLNEVLRGFISQLLYTYNKYVSEISENEEEIKSFNLIDHFKFNSIDELNAFLYSEASLEIFGHADQLTDGLIGYVNMLLMDLKDDGHDVEIVSKEFNKSIPATLFFLSKTGCRADKIRFVTNSVNEWDGLDLLITANPDALAVKPDDKIGVKVRYHYNTNTTADFEIDTIMDIIKDIKLRETILNTKITTYEKI